MHALASRGSPPRRRRLAATTLTGVVVALAALVFANPASAATNLVSDGDFAIPSEASHAGGYATFCAAGSSDPNCEAGSPVFGSWTVTSGSIDLYSNGLLAPPAGDPASTQTVDLDGNGPGAISQPFAPGPGVYQVSFAAGQNLPNCGGNTNSLKSFTYGIGANPAGSFTYDPTAEPAWITLSFPVSIPNDGNFPIFFRSDDPAGDVCGAMITDVSITPVSSGGTPLADPAVAAGGFAFLGALALGFVFLRRRHNTTLA